MVGDLLSESLLSVGKATAGGITHNILFSRPTGINEVQCYAEKPDDNSVVHFLDREPGSRPNLF